MPKTTAPTVPVAFVVKYRATETPPRCRKPRPVDHTEHVIIDLPEIDPKLSPNLYLQGTGRYGADSYFVHDHAVYAVESHTVEDDGALVVEIDHHENAGRYDYDAGQSTWLPISPAALAAIAHEKAADMVVRDGKVLTRDSGHVAGWRVTSGGFLDRRMGLSTTSRDDHHSMFIPAIEFDRLDQIVAAVACGRRSELPFGSPEYPWNAEAINALGQERLVDIHARELAAFEHRRTDFADLVARLSPGGEPLTRDLVEDLNERARRVNDLAMMAGA